MKDEAVAAGMGLSSFFFPFMLPGQFPGSLNLVMIVQLNH